MSKFSEIVVCSDSFGDYDYNLFESKKYLKRWKHTEEYKNNQPMPELPSYDCWPILLNRKLNRNVVNLSIKGYGNLAICKRTQDYVIEHHKKIDFCIVGLTKWERVEDSLLNRMCKTQSGNLNGHFYYSNNKNHEREYFLKEFNNNKRSISVYSTLRSIYELQKVCKEYDIKCIFISLLDPLPFNHTIVKTVVKNPYFGLIDTQYCIGWPFIPLLGGFNIYDKYFTNDHSYVIGNTYQITSEYKVESMWDMHPNQKGHNLICHKIIDELNNFGVINDSGIR